MIDGSHNIDLSVVVVGHVTPSLQAQEGVLSLRSCLGDGGIMLLFMSEQILLPKGEVW